MLTVSDRDGTVLVSHFATSVDTRGNGQTAVEPCDIANGVSTARVTTQPTGRLVGQVDRYRRGAEVVQTTDVLTSAHLARVSAAGTIASIHGDVVSTGGRGSLEVGVSTETVDSRGGHGPGGISVNTGLNTGLLGKSAGQVRVEGGARQGLRSGRLVTSSELLSAGSGDGTGRRIEDVDDVLVTAGLGRVSGTRNRAHSLLESDTRVDPGSTVAGIGVVTDGGVTVTRLEAGLGTTVLSQPAGILVADLVSQTSGGDTTDTLPATRGGQDELSLLLGFGDEGSVRTQQLG